MPDQLKRVFPKAALVPRQAAFEVLQVVCWSLSQFRFPGGFSANRDKQVLCRDFDSKNEPEIFSLGALDHAPAAVVGALKGAALTSSLL